jgi:glycine/D-amino acid oxidase-like deaminating enzyme
MMKFDVAIIGGGIIGSSIAYFLARTGRAGSIAVIEPDSTYALASSSSGAGGIRQLFSQPENVTMSRYSLDFYSEFESTMEVDGAAAPIDFKRRGYLFVVAEGGARQLEANYRRQAGLGVRAELLDRTMLRARFPSLRSDDVALACLSPDDGTITTKAALDGFRQKAESLGVTYINSGVTALENGGRRIQAAVLKDGEPIRAELFVNAAGAWAGEVAAMAGMRLPVVPMCRQKHFWRYQGERVIEALPLVKDESGLFFRPQGAGFVGGRPSWEVKPGFFFAAGNDQLRRYFDGYFERVVRPLLAERLPSFSAVACEQSWTGHYAHNTLDGNMILGPWAGGATNFYVAGGFSGHGAMHGPAVGMALSELILDGRFSTTDLERLSYQRVLDDEPYHEKGII